MLVGFAASRSPLSLSFFLSFFRREPPEGTGVTRERGACLPHRSLSLDSFASRVLVDFGDKGRYNYTRTQLKFEDLLSTFAKEDRVVSTRQLGLHVEAKSHGVVLGVSRDSEKRKTHLRVDFGDTRVLDVDVAHVAHAPLVPGHPIKKGDAIVAKVEYEDTKIGDSGVVLGPCDRDMQARDQRVCVLWDRTKAKNNWQPGEPQPSPVLFFVPTKERPEGDARRPAPPPPAPDDARRFFVGRHIELASEAPGQ